MNTENNAVPHGPALLDQIVSFLRQYLVCDDHQLTVLALWIAHTWRFGSFRVHPYLDIHSPEPQSGKTLCLRLLDLLCREPAFCTGADSKTIMQYLSAGRDADTLRQMITEKKSFEDQACTLLFDDCHHAFRSSERQTLLAMLNSGWDFDSQYSGADGAYWLFGPRAFAGSAPLPRSLASRCIPILLRRKRLSDLVSRLTLRDEPPVAADLTSQLRQWAESLSDAQLAAAEETPPDLPLHLTPHEQANAEPLIHVADWFGGVWPEKARAAIAFVFDAAEPTSAVQVLRDIRQLFREKNDPPYLLSRDLLAGLRELEYRPWSAWPRNAGRRLGGLLAPFNIKSRRIKVNGDTFWGYYFEDFQDAWQRYLPPITVESATCTLSATNPPPGNSLPAQ
ncbi:MAG TPA: DUF3631 domain-containing protein [Candidatus Angelobacter sp.]